ncbi:hypothetical protein Pst134EA_019614 [Puccinia striiformis f. sp. tritici]|uniref:hypothetical protein n=1 Tax=Puccinia striiformis f. sp. tritici TaxID=168172 RepID=UPI00200761F1|nr:hypothetical protein Pst134EA_019614 [Puccinia striiformis f. sp. tritici]KAH9459461.1 hypothetical protein Pst134EA_019614 [Puccinia striiformis f. sp. tritici]
MSQRPRQMLGSFSEPNDHQPLTHQFELFLNQFNRITQTVFNQVASSSLSSLSSSSSASNSNQLHEISILQEIIQLEKYLYNLLEINSKHDRNSKKIQNLYLTLTKLNTDHFKKKLDQIFAIKNQLDIICSDGQNEKIRFEEVKNCDFPHFFFSLRLHSPCCSSARCLSNRSARLIVCSISVALTPNHIMSYARLIAPYTSAPPAPSTADQDQPINPSTGLDLQDPSLRFLMPFPTEDVIRRGRMGQEMSAPVNGASDPLNSGNEIGALLGEIRTADGGNFNHFDYTLRFHNFTFQPARDFLMPTSWISMEDLPSV